MKIDAIWRELEAEAQNSGNSGWLTRFAKPDHSQPLLVGLEVGPKRRALLLPLPSDNIPPKSDWPQCRGLEIFRGSIHGSAFLGVRLNNLGDAEVFSALAEDVAPRVAASASPQQAADALMARLRKWQKFLAIGLNILSPEAVKALYGELVTMLELLGPAVGLATSVRAWMGPQHAHQDFQFPGSAVEVKTTASKGPQIVRISSERQLDTVGVGPLFLYVLSLDERTTEAGDNFEGETLPHVIDRVRGAITTSEVAGDLFEDRLLEAGYRSADADHYHTRRFAIRNSYLFEVTDGFPRVIEADLPSGIGEVMYSLSLSACDPFAVRVERLNKALNA